MNNLKRVITSIFILSAIALLATQTAAYPPFLAKAKKFGAKDCRFCHVNAEGGDPLNERGNWLVKEKQRRDESAVDPEWLANYKPTKKSKK